MARQRVIDSVQAKADSNGKVILSFNGPPSGSAWSGTASVPQADLGSNWIASFNSPNGIPLGAWLGRSFFGPVYIDSSEHLVLVGTGLTPGQTYNGTFLGVSDWADALPFVSPDPNITSLSLDQLVAQTVQAGQFLGGDYQGTWYGHAVAYFATATGLATEITNRGNADTALSTALSTESTNRVNSDNTLQTNINSEATARANADSSEATTRANADSSEATTRANADSSEATARANADLKRLQFLDYTNGIFGSGLSHSVQFLWQAGHDIPGSDGAGEFTIPFNTAFPNGLLTVIMSGGSPNSPKLDYLYTVVDSLCDNTKIVGFVTDVTTGSGVPFTGVDINWFAIGW